VGIIEIKKSDLQIGKTKQTGLRFVFEYKSKYEPNFAVIELGGVILYLTDEKNAKEILEAWEKEKKIKKEVAERHNKLHTHKVQHTVDNPQQHS